VAKAQTPLVATEGVAAAGGTRRDIVWTRRDAGAIFYPGSHRAAYGKTPHRLTANTDGGTDLGGNCHFFLGPDIKM
jgi:hypothetical protein